MKYLTLAADYLEPSIRDDGSGEQISPGESGIPADLAQEIRSWNDRYQQVIPASTQQRETMKTEISELDQLGLDLAGRIAAALGDAKVRYYSEGLLRHLDPS
ncbi:hypothetical protein [Microlunatus parietis]|uniref:Uncharacterized protein n=1 Tax=Microlunatus parietis TaxID=682979 RepID=A0A7Y9L6P9_9ACTN|nr:hypothetical protein [Microlunatus parietis]NYE69029.1 hypothetical protein [Microlunatus parietis]